MTLLTYLLKGEMGACAMAQRPVQAFYGPCQILLRPKLSTGQTVNQHIRPQRQTFMLCVQMTEKGYFKFPLFPYSI